LIGAFALVVIGKDFMLALKSGVEGRLRLVRGHLVALVFFAAAASGAMVYAERNWEYIDTVLTQMVIEKQKSSSFEQRTGADMMAIEIALDTGGVGIGLGSHKPNNIIMTLLSNTGLAGLAVFCGFLYNVLRSRPNLDTNSSIGARELAPFRWLVIGSLIVHAVSNPNLNASVLWIGFALVIGSTVAAEAHPLKPRIRLDHPTQPPSQSFQLRPRFGE
jgi:hypothetical protein